MGVSHGMGIQCSLFQEGDCFIDGCGVVFHGTTYRQRLDMAIARTIQGSLFPVTFCCNHSVCYRPDRGK